jgi:hypothetical protein
MQELKRGDIRAIKSTGEVGIITKVDKEIVQILSDYPQQHKTVCYYHLADAAGEALGEYVSLGRFKLSELDYTDEQKEEMWHEHEEHSRRANEDNHYHYYNR